MLKESTTKSYSVKKEVLYHYDYFLDPEGGPVSNNADFKPAMRDAAIKRPALPTKEYEVDLESENLHMSEHIFDTSSIRLWLNHPVKRFKPTDSKHNDPFKPAYR